MTNNKWTDWLFFGGAMPTLDLDPDIEMPKDPEEADNMNDPERQVEGDDESQINTHND